MQVQVSGKHVALGEALRTRIEDDLAGAIGKYFERGGDAEVILSRDGPAFRIDCSVRLASGQQLQSHGIAPDARTAFDHALGKIETRIRRYKRRLKSHTDAASAKEAETASLWILRAPADGPEDDEWTDASRPPAAMVIAETDSVLKTMTVSMAVMELDLCEGQTIVFRNAAHGGLSVVYRRADGNIGWIDPQRTKANHGVGAHS